MADNGQGCYLHLQMNQHPSPELHTVLQRMYAAFNARDIAAVIAYFAPQVRWPRAWEGDYITGHATVRDY